MESARKLGNYVQLLASKKGTSNSELLAVLGCTESQLLAFLKGRAFASYAQITRLADYFKVSVQELLTGDDDHYNETVVHCMNPFDDVRGREQILDIIDDYLDVFNAVHNTQS